MTLDVRLFLPQMRMDLDGLVARAVAAEDSGFGGVALMDHLAPPMAESQSMYDAITAATWLAAHTTSLGVGHLVLCDAMRHPSLLAKEIVTIDHASKGRFELGIGSGSVPAELEIFGLAAMTAGQRRRRLAETLDVVKALWTGEPVDYEGEFHVVSAGQQLPVPTRTIPIVIGGGTPTTMQLVAQHADWWNLPVHQLSRLEELRELAGDARVSIQLMVAFVYDEDARSKVAATAQARFGAYGDGLVVGTGPELLEHFRALAERGIERVYVWFADFAPPETLRRFGAEVVSQL